MKDTNGGVPDRSLVVHVSAVIAIALILPIVLYALGAGTYARVLYPLSNFVLAGYLFTRRSPWYVPHCLVVFCFVSLIRRLVDFQAGWDPSSPVLFTPYLCALYAGISFVEYWSRRQPKAFGPFLFICAAIAYGLALGVLHDRLISSAVDGLKWAVGPLLAVHVLANREQLPAIRSAVEGTLLWAGVGMGIYGVWQFVNPPAWDQFWMRNVWELGLNSIGQPEPFAVRVFSTMNSPGSFGAMLTPAIIVALKRRLPLAVSATSIMVLGLALCQYRTIWGATALAIAIVLVARPAALKSTGICAAIALSVALISSAAIPIMKETIGQRASTFGELGGDESLLARLQQYRELANDGQELILGAGLAGSGSSRRFDNQSTVVVDGGLIEIWRALGIVIGSLYLCATALLIASLFGREPDLPDLVSDRAIIIAAAIQLPMGNTLAGELGVAAWIFLAMGLGARLAASASTTRPADLFSTREPAVR